MTDYETTMMDEQTINNFIPKFEMDLAQNGAYELEMEMASRVQQSWNLLSEAGMDEENSSKLLAFLLNPKGKHGLNKMFLNQFLGKCGINHCSEEIRITTEQRAGEKEKNHHKERFFDITLSCPIEKWVIQVENKIHGGSITKKQVSEEVEQFRKNNCPTKIMVVLLPNNTLREKVKGEMENLNKDIQFVFLYWFPEISEIINAVLWTADNDEYIIQALIHLQNFCRKIGEE